MVHIYCHQRTVYLLQHCMAVLLIKKKKKKVQDERKLIIAKGKSVEKEVIE